MKIVILSLFLFITYSSLCQVKKRDQGVYKGLIPGYALNTGQDLIQVDSCTLQIRLEKNQIMIKIDDKLYEGTYQVHQKIKRTYVLHAETPYSDIKEEIILVGKDKSMSRKGLFPQPDAKLKKLKKKEVLW